MFVVKLSFYWLGLLAIALSDWVADKYVLASAYALHVAIVVEYGSNPLGFHKPYRLRR